MPNPIIEKFHRLYDLTPEKLAFLEDMSLDHPVSLMSDSDLYLKMLFDCRDDHILIIPDYDPDGIFSGLVLYYALKTLRIGQSVSLYYPLMADGFGISDKSVTKALNQFPDTTAILTTDNGISGHSGVDAAKARGLKVLVSDHHLQQGSLPSADVVVNPNRVGDAYPYKSICGTTVIHKLLREYTRVVWPEQLPVIEDLSIFAGMATVSDVMGVVDENRPLLKRTLERLNTTGWVAGRALTPSPVQPLYRGLKALLDVLERHDKIYDGVIDEGTLGYYVAPMLNAPRRVLVDPTLGFDLFRASTEQEAKQLAEDLYQVNLDRRRVVAELMENLGSLNRPQTRKGQVVSLNTTSGYPGLIAGRLNQQHNEPVIVLGSAPGPWVQGIGPIGGEVVSGSARSPEWYSIIEGLDRIWKVHPEYFVTYGGHHQAAGVTLHAEYVAAFKAAFQEDIAPFWEEEARRMDHLGVDDLLLFSLDPHHAGELVQDVSDFKEFAEYMTTLKPFGPFFPQPEVGFQFNINDLTTEWMGPKKQHFKATDPKTGLEFILWNGEPLIKSLRSDDWCCWGYVQLNHFRGTTKVQVSINWVTGLRL